MNAQKSFWVAVVSITAALVLMLGAMQQAYAATAAGDVAVTVSSNAFTPQAVTINVGESVTWTNTQGTHNVVADDGSFTSGAPSSDNWTHTETFNMAGTYQYFCELHGNTGGIGMSGTVTVNAPTAVTLGDLATSGQESAFGLWMLALGLAAFGAAAIRRRR